MQQQIIPFFFPSEKHTDKENSKFCSQDQAITLIKITNLMFPMADHQIAFFSFRKANKQALHEICECALV